MSVFTECLGRGKVIKGSSKYATTTGDEVRVRDKSSHITKAPSESSSLRNAAEKVQASVTYILGVDALVHALQAERGASGIFLASGGRRLAHDLTTLIENADTAWAKTEQLSSSCSAFLGSSQGTPGLDISQLQEMRAKIQSLEVDHYQVHDSYTWNIDVLLSTSTMAKAVEILEATPVGDILSKYLTLLHLKEHTGRFRSLVGGMASCATIQLPEEGHIELVAILACIAAFGKCFSINAPSLHMINETTSEAIADQVKNIIAAVWESREAAEVALTSNTSPETWFKLLTARMEYIHQMQEELATRMQAAAQEYCRDASVLREPRKSSLLKVLLGRGKSNCTAAKDKQEEQAQTEVSRTRVRKPSSKFMMLVHGAPALFRDDPLGARKVLASCNYILGVNALVHAVQAERGASGIFVASGGRLLGDVLETLIGHVDTALANTKQLSIAFSIFADSFGGTPGLDTSEFQEMRTKVEACEVDRFQVHDSYVQKIDLLLSTMAKAIKILEATPVGEILSKYLILLHLKEQIGRFRSIVGGMTSSDTIKLSEKEHVELVAILSHIMVFGKCFTINAPSVQMNTDEAITDKAYPDQVKDIIAAITESREAAEAALANIDPETWFRLISQRMASINKLQQELADKIQAAVQAYCQDSHDVKALLEFPRLSDAFSRAVAGFSSLQTPSRAESKISTPKRTKSSPNAASVLAAKLSDSHYRPSTGQTEFSRSLPMLPRTRSAH